MDWSQQEVVRLLKNAPGTHYQEADDTGKAVLRDWVRGLLQQTSVTVSFTKADGTERDMLCTLDWDKIPKEKQPIQQGSGVIQEGKQRKQPDEHSLRVFDLEKNEWRSFRFDRLRKVTASIGFE